MISTESGASMILMSTDLGIVRGGREAVYLQIYPLPLHYVAQCLRGVELGDKASVISCLVGASTQGGSHVFQSRRIGSFDAVDEKRQHLHGERSAREKE